jgi:AcrR family transcriptional regulator
MDEMARTPVTEKRPRRRAAVRSGRPPKELAGEVEERILDAARKVFLDRGFEGASIEKIAEAARSGKPTIYARFPNKQALFAGAFMGSIITRSAQSESDAPYGTTIEERLVSIGVALLQMALTSEIVGLTRLAIAEARRFPDLGSGIINMARERGAETTARLLGEIAESGELGILRAFDPDRLATTAQYFLDFVLLPMLMRALSGENLETLHAEIGPHISQRVAFFLAACRNGGIT